MFLRAGFAAQRGWKEALKWVEREILKENLSLFPQTGHVTTLHSLTAQIHSGHPNSSKWVNHLAQNLAECLIWTKKIYIKGRHSPESVHSWYFSANLLIIAVIKMIFSQANALKNQPPTPFCTSLYHRLYFEVLIYLLPASWKSLKSFRCICMRCRKPSSNYRALQDYFHILPIGLTF